MSQKDKHPIKQHKNRIFIKDIKGFFSYKLSRKRVIIGGIVSIICVVGIILASLNAASIREKESRAKINQLVSQNTVIKKPTATPTLPTPTIPPCKETPFKFPTDNQVHLLNTDLCLFKKAHLPVSYYAAGAITGGKYKGYKRIIAVQFPFNSLDIYSNYIFVTNDFQTYIVQAIPFSRNSFIGGDVYTSRVIKADDADQSFPEAIPLPNHFALYRNNLVTEINYGKDDKPGEALLVTDFSSYIPLASFGTSLKMYTPNRILKDSYFSGSTKIIVVDASGLAYVYTLTYPENINKSKIEYYDDTDVFASGFGVKNAYINTSFDDSAIQASQPTAKRYIQQPFTANCSFIPDSLIPVNITDADLIKIGSLYGSIDLYALKDVNNPLFQYVYELTKLRIKEWGGNGLTYPPLPSYDKYFTSNPLLFMKDPWGRWFFTVDSAYLFAPGGCGKPVIYLYPTKPTEVKVEFRTAMQLDVQIPRYRNGWNVLAQPDGVLTDLLQKSSDCNFIDNKRFGSEYALEACRKNQYPYLYWAGQTLETHYNTPTMGAIVARDELSKYLNNTLDEIGFKSNEKEDMLSYWLPKMLKKDAPYYRVSFLQTPEVNLLFPLNITPKPDSMYRLFMDWEPLDNKPTGGIPPQHFEKINRTGFFLLEWGGVNR